MIMHQPNFRGKHFRIKGGKITPVPKPKNPSPRQRAAKEDIARASKKRWEMFLRLAREYTTKHRHVNVAELIVHFHYKKIPLPEALAKKLLVEIAREKKK